MNKNQLIGEDNFFFVVNKIVNKEKNWKNRDMTSQEKNVEKAMELPLCKQLEKQDLFFWNIWKKIALLTSSKGLRFRVVWFVLYWLI